LQLSAEIRFSYIAKCGAKTDYEIRQRTLVRNAAAALWDVKIGCRNLAVSAKSGGCYSNASDVLRVVGYVDLKSFEDRKLDSVVSRSHGFDGVEGSSDVVPLVVCGCASAALCWLPGSLLQTGR